MSAYFSSETTLKQVQQDAWTVKAGRQFLQVRPGGKANGLDFDASGVEYVVLDDKHIAYRTSEETIDGDWNIGDAETVVSIAEGMDDAYATTDDERPELRYN